MTVIAVAAVTAVVGLECHRTRPVRSRRRDRYGWAPSSRNRASGTTWQRARQRSLGSSTISRMPSRQRLGRSGIQVVEVPFNQLIAGKSEKKFDVAFEQALISDDAPVEFSVPYLAFDVGILVRTGTTVADLPAARALRWGVATGVATPLTFLQEELEPTASPQTYPDLTKAVAALERQEVDAVLDYTVSTMKQASQSGGRLSVVGQLRSGEKLGAVLPEDSDLLPEVNAGIKAFKADGTIGRLAVLYLGGDPSTVPFLKR